MSTKKITIILRIFRILLYSCVVLSLILLNFIPRLSIYHFDTLGYTQNIEVDDNSVFIADYYGGMPVIDISDDFNSELIASIFEPNILIYDVQVHEGKIFIANGNMMILNNSIGTPILQNPISEVQITGNAIKLHLNDDFAYVISEFYMYDISGTFQYSKRVVIVDVTNPQLPKILIYTYLGGTASDIFVSDEILYIADLTKGLAIINVTDPSNPGNPNFFELDGFARGIYVTGGYAYVAEGSNGLTLINISDPANPGKISTVDILGVCLDVWVEENTAYVACSERGIAIIDVSDPFAPSAPIYIDTAGYTQSIDVKNGIIYAADGSNGLVYVDLSNIIDEIQNYNKFLFQISLILIILSPVGLIMEIIFLFKWIVKKENEYKRILDKLERIKPLIVWETLIGVIKTGILGCFTGNIMFASFFMPEAILKTSNGEIMEILINAITISFLIGVVSLMFFFPMFKNLYLEISIGFVLGAMIGTSIGATYGVMALVKGLLSGMVAGSLFSLIILIASRQGQTNIQIKREIKRELNNIDSKLNSLNDAAKFAYDNKRYVQYLQLKSMIIDILLDLIYFFDFKHHYSQPLNYKELFLKIEKQHKIQLVNTKDFNKWVQISSIVENEDIIQDIEIINEFNIIFNSIYQKLDHLKTMIKK